MSVLLEPSPTVQAHPHPTRRPEIDGLRALAVALVVAYHVTTGQVSGGVDVFLALSGFFLVHGLIGQVARSGRVRPLTSITRTLSRLVPPAVLVLAGTVAASALFLPETRWRELAGHLIASATFTENRRLVAETVDYAASNAIASPVQQFWSLSIQVQVLLAAPVVVAAGALLFRGRRRRFARPAAVLTVAAVTGASFAWSVVATRADQQAAYFSTLPRLWELGAGALLALTLSGVRPGRRTGVLLGWGALVALVACGAVLDGAHAFPGWQAAWPVACALALLLVADSGGRLGVHRLLALRSLRWLGTRSYALYLWHWPVLVLYLVHTGRESPSVKGAAAVVLLSLALAEATYRLVERPAAERLRGRSPVRVLGLVAAGLAPLLVLGAGTTVWLDRETARVAAATDDPQYPGAVALSSPVVATGGIPGVEPLPSLSVIRDDHPFMPGAECTVEDDPPDAVPTQTETCFLGSDDRERRIVIVGDSHAAHWLSPLADLAERHPWQLVSLIRAGCSLSTHSEFFEEGTPGHEGCVAWQSRLVERIVSLDPDLVVTVGTRTAYGTDPEILPPGFLDAWQQLSDAGLPVIAMRDSPRHLHDVPDCVAQWGGDTDRCGTPRSWVYSDDLLDAADAVLPAGVSLMDTSSLFCTDDLCPALVGNTWVYRDDGHVTGTYMRTVGPLVEDEFLSRAGW
ncbi:Peptidoglycan/LPS O-acetylase OafA/YrhL, contains acyltransferase and SGNH-hydrolase domains [Geodermatophilus obscurus]|uniref:Peptidoglycan/LPS O-acetylase OafA/YrhL, contains acyltransferase and SGNH-hydrolase domains n=1 Tax=Geodermatophilus obscurus TaxID=1861 RepID=A0A1M7UIK0_9ACTN|nr:acyltransferase family protein [Geodermatophilus obscurus]SHN82778.1 Peptidoglycan/LPS O-acetylase OafA/YrhL, contains acyltransferase and SGNH-hydrolase domains [Geodermatophilus obscurus]